MRDLLVTLIVFGSLPYILARPHIGVLVWSWLGYMNPHRLSWGFAYDFPFAQIVAITLMLSLLFSREPKRIPITALTLVWLLFIIWMGLTTAFAIYLENAQPYFIRVIKIQLIIFFTLMLMRDKQRLTLLILIIVISLGFFGVKGGAFTILSGGSFRVWGPPESFVEDNNSLAVALLMTIPLLNYLRLQSQNKWAGRVILVAMVLCGAAAVGTYSRGAFLAAFAMMAFLWLKGKQRIVGGLILTVTVSIILAFMPDTWHQRMNTINTYEQDASAMGRINSWHYAVNVANDRVLGAGFESWEPETFSQYAPVPEDVHAAHSIYFSVLADHGWIGLIMFLTIFLLAWRNCTWVIRQARRHMGTKWLGDLASMIQVSFVAYAVGGAFLSLSYFDLPWHLVAIAVIARSIASEQIRPLEAHNRLNNAASFRVYSGER